ncbi:hypothetical protein M8C21_029162 [Ambrosia artemisiifolia]|uniref:MATH domain-containing protein n=1 Tax=Ambrosia artemisiifolia TaxID=4212 RepID=A0AAD5DB11_AMBAR|nr:hypothetical protein M8C21_029162 [Ambrosia artemisiifolia]
MAGSSSEESGVGRSLEGLSNGQQRSGEALAEWRSSEQVENGITSTSPPYWDTEDDDDDCGLKPSELYGKYTWKIDKFSQINKRELRSNAFEVGGHKWYILIYPQGCDVCNHLSLFLCVANHDKLLPGWSHFAQFTIAVVNKDPKKSKYSDTLHRFWKKEHDWGWKKERADRPFRCLDRNYRRELVRVYLSNVEQICRRYVEDKRGRLGKLIEDKDGGAGDDFSKDSTERDERRLTELGRRTIEIFVLAHIFSSKIEVAYQEAISLKRQEELIREEEEAWMAESEQKAKRASEKEKKLKKKQAKQKRNNRKLKDKGRDEKPGVVIEENPQEQSPFEVDADLLKKPDPLEDVSDVSDSLLRPDSDGRDSSPVYWDTDASEPHQPSTETCSGVLSEQNGVRKCLSVMDDSSSTCSSDSLPSTGINGPHEIQKTQSSPSRGSVKRGKDTVQQHAECVGVATSLQDNMKCLEQDVVKKVEEVVSLQKKLIIKDDIEPERLSKDTITVSVTSSSPKSPSKASPRTLKTPDLKTTAQTIESGLARKQPSENAENTTKPAGGSPNSIDGSVVSKPYPQITATQKPPEKPSMVHQTANPAQKPVNGQGTLTAEKPVVQQVLTKRVTGSLTKPVPPPSRPLSAPLVEGSRPNAASTTPVISMVQTGPFLSRSASAAGYLGPDPSSMGQSYGPPSYRNAMMGTPVSATSTSFSQTHSHSYSQPVFLPQTPERIDSLSSIRPAFSFGMMKHEVVPQNGPQWMESFQRDNGSSRSQPQSMLVDEFPHLDIINDLLDDEYAMPIASSVGLGLPFHNGAHRLSHQFTFPGDGGGSLDQGTSTSSCGFDRSHSFQEELQHGYRGGFDFTRDMTLPQPNLQPYVNGQVDELVQNRWQIGGSDLSYELRNMDGDGYAYHMAPPDYSNLTMGVNGYTLYRPSNGQ